MTRLLCFAVAIGLSAAAHAETFSFSVGGHHISISAARNCYRASCLSVSIPGLVTTRRNHGDDVTAQDTAPATPAAPARPAPKAPAAIASAPVAAPAAPPKIVPAAPPLEARAAAAPPPPLPPPAPKLTAIDSSDVAVPPPPAAPVKTAATETPAEQTPAAQPIPDKPSAEAPPAEPVAEPPLLAPPATPAIAASDPAPAIVTKVVEARRDATPLGDWQTEGKVGAVRIEACGKALCGYLINPASRAKAETILINMRPKGDSETSRDMQWRGSIFSRASGNTYNATMTLKSANVLRVEACALGPFLCSGNDWTRVLDQPAALVTSRDDDSEPRS